MDKIYLELKILVAALHHVVNSDKKFFNSIAYYVERLNQSLSQPNEQIKIDEIKILGNKIEEFYERWRPSDSSDSVLFIPPRQTSDSDKTVQDITALINKLEAGNH
jgi:hypothetical protein